MSEPITIYPSKHLPYKVELYEKLTCLMTGQRTFTMVRVVGSSGTIQIGLGALRQLYEMENKADWVREFLYFLVLWCVVKYENELSDIETDAICIADFKKRGKYLSPILNGLLHLADLNIALLSRSPFKKRIRQAMEEIGHRTILREVEANTIKYLKINARRK